jgi:DNA-binding NarL/FixJ family response regulator
VTTNGAIRVVLVDDVAGLRALVRMALEVDGRFTVVGEAGNGADGIEVSRDLKPDLVLLDLSMPVMDGLEALPQILEASPDSRVVVLTGFESRRVSPMALKRGAVACLEKGITPSGLVESLTELLGVA